MRHRLSFLFASILLLSFFGSAQAANIVATLDRNQVFLDESFKLIFESSDSVDGDPDFTPLRNNFEILNQSHSTNMSYVNGNYSRKGVWSLVLMAKHIGSFTIPSISFGNDLSPALRILIKDPATAKKSTNKNKDIFVEVDLDQDKAWVQSQIIYKVRLFSRISMSNLQISEPATSDPDAIIKNIGEAKTYEANKDGLRYAVYELSYAVFPQHSGELKFNPIMFEGNVNRGRSQSIFDQFTNRGERKRVRSDSISIEVQARPDNIKLANWLPAKGITLEEQWSEDANSLKNGEPVTRTITITAHGTMAENLPDLSMGDIDQLKQYPDKALLDNRVSNHGISSVKQIKVALIPTRSGDFKLPAIAIPWWNTKTGKQEIARLPEKLIRAQGEPAKPAAVIADNSTPQSKENKDAAISLATIPEIIHAGYWPWLSLVLGIGWLITLIALFRKKPKVVTEKPKQETVALRALEKAVNKHSKNNDAEQTKNALIDWAKARWPELAMNSLADIEKNTAAELAAEIKQLNSALYAANASQWQGTALANAFKHGKQHKTSTHENSSNALEPLYKT